MERLICFVLLPAVLLGLSWAIHAGSLWSSSGNHTLSWFCTAVALAQVIVGMTSLLAGGNGAPSTRSRTAVVIGIAVILGIGTFVDDKYYSDSSDWLVTLLEIVGFTVVLSGLFALEASGRRDRAG